VINSPNPTECLAMRLVPGIRRGTEPHELRHRTCLPRICVRATTSPNQQLPWRLLELHWRGQHSCKCSASNCRSANPRMDPEQSTHRTTVRDLRVPIRNNRGTLNAQEPQTNSTPTTPRKNGLTSIRLQNSWAPATWAASRDDEGAGGDHSGDGTDGGRDETT
jgi:hypothetical protein